MPRPRSASVRLVPVLALVASLAACQTPHLGQVSPRITELYDLLRPDGGMELELDRSGNVLEIEAECAIDDVPAHLREAQLARFPGAELVGAERELKASGPCWELKLVHEGRRMEIMLDASGTVVETEKEVLQREAPAAVVNGANRALAGGELRSIEIIERGEVTEYHVKKAKDGMSYKLVLTPRGELLRLVREARAEIEIPVR